MICPACGFKLASLDREVGGLIRRGEAEEYVRAMCCDACRALYLVEPTLDENGVGPDRLVPVLDEPPKAP